MNKEVKMSLEEKLKVCDRASELLSTAISNVFEAGVLLENIDPNSRVLKRFYSERINIQLHVNNVMDFAKDLRLKG